MHPELFCLDSSIGSHDTSFSRNKAIVNILSLNVVFLLTGFLMCYDRSEGMEKDNEMP